MAGAGARTLLPAEPGARAWYMSINTHFDGGLPSLIREGIGLKAMLTSHFHIPLCRTQAAHIVDFDASSFSRTRPAMASSSRSAPVLPDASAKLNIWQATSLARSTRCARVGVRTVPGIGEKRRPLWPGLGLLTASATVRQRRWPSSSRQTYRH